MKNFKVYVVVMYTSNGYGFVKTYRCISAGIISDFNLCELIFSTFYSVLET